MLFMENFGLDGLADSEDTVGGLMRHVAQEGKPIVGYYGLPYFNLHYGDVQMILRTEHSESGNGLNATGIDSHAAGRAIWEARLSGADINLKDADLLSRRAIINMVDGSGGLTVVTMVNADVLPSFMEGDVVKMQVIAFPELVEYFPDEDAYADSQPSLENGGKFLVELGTCFPTGFMRNRGVGSSEFESDEHLDDIVNVRGIVKALYHGKFEIGGEAHDTFIRCVIDTAYGPLEIAHSIEQVKEEQRKDIRVGAMVNIYGTISADVAIYDYEDGIVRDEEHDLAALRYMFSGNDPERIRSILADDATYLAEYNGVTYTGANAIIERLVNVQAETTRMYFAHFATITDVKDVDDPLPFGKGKRCLVLAANEEDNYESIAFIDVNQDGNIQRIVTSTNPRYVFSVDPKPKRNSIFDDAKLPDTVMEPILLRARFSGMLDSSITDDAVLNNDEFSREFENNIRQLLDTMPEGDDAVKAGHMENMFGYLFAKAIEMSYSMNQMPDLEKGSMVFGRGVNYDPSDCWRGQIHTQLPSEMSAKVENAFEKGKRFYKDFKFFLEQINGEDYEGNLTKALMTVQNIGCLYSPKCLG